MPEEFQHCSSPKFQVKAQKVKLADFFYTKPFGREQFALFQCFHLTILAVVVCSPATVTAGAGTA